MLAHPFRQRSGYFHADEMTPITANLKNPTLMFPNRKRKIVAEPFCGLLSRPRDDTVFYKPDKVQRYWAEQPVAADLCAEQWQSVLISCPEQWQDDMEP